MEKNVTKARYLMGIDALSGLRIIFFKSYIYTKTIDKVKYCCR
jgi:hypothetical protein